MSTYYLWRLNKGLQISPLVKEQWRFTMNHVRGAQLATYTLHCGDRVCLCHSKAGIDPLTLEEIYAHEEYQITPEVRERVSAHGGPIIDVGGNIGLAALWFEQSFPGQQIRSYEPDPDNLRKLRRCAEINRRDWQIIPAAASNQDGELRFQTGLEWESHVADDGNAVVPAVDLFRDLDGAALLKMDIEGGEWSILGDPRFADVRVPVVVLEHHAHLCPNGGDSARKTAAAALQRAGYTVHPGEERETGKGILWGIRS